MKDYLTIKDSALLVDRHERTIRRVIIQKRETINKNEGYEVVKHIDKKYYISTQYLHNRYDIKDNNKTINTTENNELQELRETVKMYAIMLEEKDKQIELLKIQIDELKEDKKYLFSNIDQSQKLTALEKQLEILKIEK